MIKVLTPEDVRIRQILRYLADRERPPEPPEPPEPPQPPRLDEYPQRRTGPALAAEVHAATARPEGPKPLVGAELYRWIVNLGRVTS